MLIRLFTLKKSVVPYKRYKYSIKRRNRLWKSGTKVPRAYLILVEYLLFQHLLVMQYKKIKTHCRGKSVQV